MLRGEIYSIDLGNGLGRELSGIQLVVVVSDNFTNSLLWNITVVPGVDARKKSSGIIAPAGETGLQIDLLLLPTQIRSVDYSRFTSPSLGTVNIARLNALNAVLKNQLDIK